MSRRSRRSRRKLNSLFMTLLLTGMLLLTSTYAWFSANKEVALEGINAKVVAAEGLQISLDGEAWSSKITINKVSTLSGLPHTTLLSFMNEETHDPRISTLLHICEAFDISLNDFFNDKLFKDVKAE